MEDEGKRETVLVTGGTGFLGRTLVNHLVQMRKRVRVIGRRVGVRWRRNPNVEYIRADISAPQVLEAALKNIQTVFHLAAATEGDWPTFKAVTVDATSRLLEVFASQGGGRLVYVSSLGNYDINSVKDKELLDERFPLEQNTAGRGCYARAKVMADYIAQDYLQHPNVHLTIVRPGIVYGPGMKNPLSGVAFTIFGKFHVVAGSGNKPLPLIYIDDVVRGIGEIAKSDDAPGKIYNMICARMPTQNEYLHVYRKMSGDQRPVVRVSMKWAIPPFRLADYGLSAVSGRNYHLAYKAERILKEVYYSCELLKKDLGFEAGVDLQEGLSKSFLENDHGR